MIPATVPGIAAIPATEGIGMNPALPKIMITVASPHRFIFVLAVYLIVTCQPAYATLSCAYLFTEISKDNVTRPRQTIWDLLNQESNNGKEIIQFLSQDAQLRELFEASAGVSEGYSIKEHTLMVFDVFAEQFPVYQRSYQFKAKDGVRLFQTLKFAIALHDIGKPYAIQKRNKDRQHEFTVPILERALSHFGFSESETRLAKALVGNDIMGDLVKGNIDPKDAKSKIAKVAEEAGMSIQDYIPLQFLFYTIDAASYPYLRQRVFTTSSDGLLIPNRPQFQQLWIEVQTP